jgi:transcription elongation factor GreA
MSQQKLTEQGYKELQKQREALLKEQAENLIAIKEARSQGDLSENADYSSARENQSKIISRLNEVENQLKNAEIVSGNDENNFSKFITVRFLDDNEEQTYQLVGSAEADPLQQKMSDASPLGQAVLTAEVGQEVLVKTEYGSSFKVKVLDIKDTAPKAKTRARKTSK